MLLSSYESVVGSLREHPELAPQFNVRYALQDRHFIHGWDRHYLPPPDELAEALGARVRYRDEEERVVTELLDVVPPVRIDWPPTVTGDGTSRPMSGSDG